MDNYLKAQYQNILNIQKKLLVIDEQQASLRPSDNKWSIKEVVGHLIDSAINNHQRFVLMQIQDNLVFAGYDQNKWALLQNYQSREFKSLVETWAVLNLNCVKALQNVNPALWHKTFEEHSFATISWQKLNQSQPATINYLVMDYFEHMMHHLKQVTNVTDISFE